MQVGDERVAPAEGEFDPIPADFQVALATEPMRVDPATFALCDHGCALCHQIQGRDGQHTTQTLERVRRPNQRRLQLEAIGLISSAVLFDVKTPSILRKRL